MYLNSLPHSRHTLLFFILHLLLNNGELAMGFEPTMSIKTPEYKSGPLPIRVKLAQTKTHLLVEGGLLKIYGVTSAQISLQATLFRSNLRCLI